MCTSGLSFNLNWVLILLILFAYATSMHEMKSWAIIVPPWSPLLWTLHMYIMFVCAGPSETIAQTGGALEYSPARFR